MTEHSRFLAEYLRVRERMEAKCLLTGVRPQDVDDVMQETVAVVLDGYVRKKVRSIDGWLFGVLKKQISMYHRKRRHLDSRFAPLGAFDFDDPDAEMRLTWLLEHADRRRSITRGQVRMALLSLGRTARALVLLKAQDYSPGEIARMVGVSPESTRKLYLRAIERLRLYLAPSG